MYRALTSGQADVISAFQRRRIAADDLADPGRPPPRPAPYDAVVLVSPKRANDQRLLGVLKPLIGKIDVTAMRAANLSVDRDTDKASPAQAATALAATLPN